MLKRIRLPLGLGLALITLAIGCVYSGQLYNSFWIPKALVFSALISLLILLWLNAAWKQPRFFVQTLSNPGSLCLAILAGVIGLSALGTDNPSVTWWGSYWRQMGLVLTLPLLAVTWLALPLFQSARWRWYAIYFLAFCSIPYATIGVLQRMGCKVLGLHVLYERAGGLQGNPDFYAPILLILFFLVLTVVVESFRRSRWGIGGLWVGVLLLQLIAIIGTMTRGTWIGLGVGTVFFFSASLFAFGWRIAAKRVMVGILALGVVAIILFIGVVGLNQKSSALYENGYEKLHSILTLQTKSGQRDLRVMAWGDTLAFCWNQTKAGKIFGSGWENFLLPFMKERSIELAQVTKNVNFDEPHQQYLALWAKAGPLAPLAFLALQVVLVCAGVAVARRARNAAHRVMALGVTSAFVAFSANLLSIFPTIEMSFLFAILVALICALAWPAKRQAVAFLTLRRGLLLVVGLLLFALSVASVYHFYCAYRADAYYESARKRMLSQDVNVHFCQQTVKILDQAVAWNPMESFYVEAKVRAMGLLARALLNGGQRDQAEKVYIEAGKLGFSYLDRAWNKDILLMSLGVNAIAMKNYDPAFLCLEDALKVDPWCYKVHTLLGTMYYRRYELKGQTQDLIDAFNHFHCSSTYILKYVPYWDPGAVDYTFRSGLMLYQHVLDPELLDMLLDALLNYAIYGDNRQQLRQAIELFQKTPGATMARLTDIIFEEKQLKKNPALSISERRRIRQQLRQSFEDAGPFSGPVYQEMQRYWAKE